MTVDKMQNSQLTPILFCRQTEPARYAAETLRPSSARASWNNPNNQLPASTSRRSRKKPTFLLPVCCFKTNFCQNRHIASLVFLPHTGECYSVSRASPIHLSIWQIPAVCKIDGKTFLNSTFFCCKFINFS